MLVLEILFGVSCFGLLGCLFDICILQDDGDTVRTLGTYFTIMFAFTITLLMVTEFFAHPPVDTTF